jgi:hypothetical protein
MGNISGKCCKMVKTFSESLALYDRMWEKMAQPETPQMTIYYGVHAMRAG